MNKMKRNSMSYANVHCNKSIGLNDVIASTYGLD